jgi:hypothetical protein
VSAVENSEGKGTTFYSWLDVPATASVADIARAYRKLSVKIQYVTFPTLFILGDDVSLVQIKIPMSRTLKSALPGLGWSHPF